MVKRERPKRVLAIGNTIIDTVLTMPRMPIDDKVWVESKKRFVGGQGANAAQDMAMLGLEVSFLTRLGDDDEGRLAQARFRELGLDLSHCIVAPGAATMSACVTIATETMQRSCLMHRDPKMFEVELEEKLRAVELSEFDAVYSDGFQLDLAMPVVEAAVKLGLPVIVDIEVIDDNTTALANLASHLVAPLESICKLAGTKDPFQAVRVVAKGKATGSTVIATDGANGSYGVESPESSSLHVSACDCKVLDTVGAGDAYHAGYIHAMLEQGQRDLRERMSFATRVAAALVETPGPTVTPEALARWKAI